jgi:hypothetical protein
LLPLQQYFALSSAEVALLVAAPGATIDGRSADRRRSARPPERNADRRHGTAIVALGLVPAVLARDFLGIIAAPPL